MSDDTPATSVTGRVLSILSVFERAVSPRTLTEISAETGLALSTTHRLLAELEAWGAVRRDDNGRYQVGLRLWELGQRAGQQARDLARPLLQDLYTLTRETVHLAIREGSDVLYIDRIYGTRRVPKTSRVGGRLPLHVSAVGKVLLAFEEEWVRTSVLQQPLERRTPFTVTDPVVLADELDMIRLQGYSVTVDEVTVGSTSIAVPVFQQGGGLSAALGIVVPTDPTQLLERHLPALRGIAKQLEVRIGRYPLRTLVREGRDAHG